MKDESPRISCPTASPPAPVVTLAHGEGARLSRELLQQHVARYLHDPELLFRGDAAVLPPLSGNLAFTTDSFVVSPLFFPGGSIGSLAVYGTCNDLAVSGAQPRYLSLSLILEEGLGLETLDHVLADVHTAAAVASVSVVTGDTKVVPRGAADCLYINTAGIGELRGPDWPGPGSLQPGDALIVSGPVGRHGVAILAARDQLGFSPTPRSDCGPLWPAIEALKSNQIQLRATRDATRGGLSAVLHEWAMASGCTLRVDEACVPVSDDVRGVCELLGLDPLHSACEGTMVLGCAPCDVPRVLACLQTPTLHPQSSVIGEVLPRGTSPVTIRRGLGREVALVEPLGALFPRIC